MERFPLVEAVVLQRHVSERGSGQRGQQETDLLQ